MVELYKSFLTKYDIIFLEDPLAEDDWEGFADITKQIGSKYEVSRVGLGDCTQQARHCHMQIHGSVHPCMRVGHRAAGVSIRI